MALTVSIAPATAPVPAARPARAAAPAAAGVPEGFAAVLARTADRPAPTGGQPASAGDGDTEVEEAPERDETFELIAVSLGLEPCLRFVSPIPESDASEVALVSALDDANDEEPQVQVIEEPQEQGIEGTGGAPAAPQATTDAPAPIVNLAPEVDAPVTAPPVPAVGPRTPGPDVAVQPAARSIAHGGAPSEFDGGKRQTASEPRLAEESSSVERSSGQQARKESSPAFQAPRSVGPVVPFAAQSPAPRAEARAAAQAIVAEALSITSGTAPAPAPDPGRVATTAILTSAAPLVPSDPGTSTGKPRVAQVPVDALAVEAGEVVGPTPGQSQTSGHGTAQQQAQDHGQSAGRAVGVAHAAGLPASMVFPGQATFSAAMEPALPLAQALPPGIGESALETVVPQVVRSMHMQVTAGGGDMKMTLTPEHLGTVTIELRVEQQRVTASLAADTPAVRVWIAAHEQDLRAGLADLGLHLDEFVVRDDDPRERKEQGEGQHAPKPRKREKSEESVFEVQA